jgi:hypothetical protein
VSNLAREGEGLIRPLQGLIGITKIPERYCRPGQAGNGGVLAVNERMGAVSLGVVERDTLVQMFPGDRWFSKGEGCNAECLVRLEERRRISHTLGQVEELLGETVPNTATIIALNTEDSALNSDDPLSHFH